MLTSTKKNYVTALFENPINNQQTRLQVFIMNSVILSTCNTDTATFQL